MEDRKFFHGGILTAAEIRKGINAKAIEIEDFDESRLNPNSYNLRLHPHLKVYASQVQIIDNDVFLNNSGTPLDIKKQNETIELYIPETGLVLKPGILYIGRTVERTFSDLYIPKIDGRSSGGRFGIDVHICAGFGDIGFNGTWTLEIRVVHPVIVYPYVEIAQISFYTAHGAIEELYNGKYMNQVDPTESKMFKDFEKNNDSFKEEGNKLIMFAMMRYSTGDALVFSPNNDQRDLFTWLKESYICTTSDAFRKLNLGYITDKKEIVLIRKDTEDNSITDSSDILFILKELKRHGINVNDYLIRNGSSSFRINI